MERQRSREGSAAQQELAKAKAIRVECRAVGDQQHSEGTWITDEKVGLSSDGFHIV